MINQKSLTAVADAGFGRGFCKPLYHSYCFSRLPNTILHLLTGQNTDSLPIDTYIPGDYDVLIFFLIDGFGWRFLDRYAKQFPFLKQIMQEGIVSQLTSQFPSTTAAHVTCMNTNLNVGQSGVYEWFYYEPKVQRMIAPLLFSFAGDHQPATLLSAGYQPQDFYPQETFYQKLAEHQITSYILESPSILHAPYSQVTAKGAEKIPCNTLSEALKLIPEICKKKTTQKAYFYVYFDAIDAMGHRHGIGSEPFEQAIHACWTTLEQELCCPPKTACFLTADHGMTEVCPEQTFYLNEEMPQLLPYFKRGKDGKPLAPAGSCRDFFLHLEEKNFDVIYQQLQDRLKEKAMISPTKTLIDQCFFSDRPPSHVFLERIGNLVILPYAGESVWWREKHRFNQHFFAMHGGLTRGEMEIPLLFFRS